MARLKGSGDYGENSNWLTLGDDTPVTVSFSPSSIYEQVQGLVA